MRLLKGVALLLAAIIAVFLVLASRQPDEFRVTRALQMDAPPERVFSEVNRLKAWDAWSPWAKLDPNAANTFSGPEEGPGASLRWSGNSEVGEGVMTIEQSVPSELVRLKLEFIRPMPGVNTSEFTFTPEAGGTRVTWTMFGPNHFIGKMISVVMNCEKMVGEQFEKGLQNLKNVTERR